MPTVGETARVKVTGTRGVTHESPIQDIVKAVYDAAYRYAKDSRFEPHVHKGPHGVRHGLAGPLVMKRLVSQVLPGTPDEKLTAIYGIVTQALKRTDSAVCVRPPKHHGTHKGPMPREDMPLWFINHKIAGNIVPVVLAQAGKSADQNRTPVFSEREFLTARERRLPDTDVERPAGEVTVTKRTAEERVAPLRDILAQRTAEHEMFVRRVLEEIQTQPVPVTASDLCTIINRDDGADWELTTIRNALNKLEKQGKVVKRKETKQESKVRGGGELPKATRPNLYVASPGPVPTRMHLPDGIEPIMSARAYTDMVAKSLETDRKKIMDVLKVRSKDSPRTTGHIAAAAGLDHNRAKTVLESLQADDLVYHNYSSWFPSFVRQKRAETTPESSPLPPPPPVDTVVPTATDQPNQVTSDNLSIVLDLAARLGVSLPSGDATEIESLKAANAALEEQVGKLKKQVTALRAAIEAFEV